MRTRMAHLLQDDTVMRWWLPNNEGFSPVLQSVRAFADERGNTPALAAQQSSQSRNMREVLDSLVDLQLQDTTEESPGRGNR